MPDLDPKTDPIMDRLEDQIKWYDGKSSSNQKGYKGIKIAEILAAACIPFIGSFPIPHVVWITGGLGVLITVLEGLLHLNQSQQNWINYRSTNEALKHEKYLYLAHAGPYGSASDPHALLAERIESLIAEEHAKWSSVQQPEKAAKPIPVSGDAAPQAAAGAGGAAAAATTGAG